MSEEMLSGEERNNILKQVFTPVTETKDFNTPKSKEVNSEGKAALSLPTFGELLEQTIAIREQQDQEDQQQEEVLAETREQAIKASRMDILEGWRI